MGKSSIQCWRVYKTNSPTLRSCSLERNTRPSVGNLYLSKTSIQSNVARWAGPLRLFWSVIYQSNGKSSGVNLKPSTNLRLCIAIVQITTGDHQLRIAAGSRHSKRRSEGISLVTRQACRANWRCSPTSPGDHQ